MHEQIDGERVAELFDLGPLRAPPELKASGWGGHNLLWQLRTQSGVWAVKQVRRDLPQHVDEAFAIERAAHEGGIPTARPIPSHSGRCYETVSGVPTRCHVWVSGAPKNNEDVSVRDANTMGGIVAELHQLEIPVVSSPFSPVASFDREHWRELLARGDAGRPWAVTIAEHVDALVAVDNVVAQHGSSLAAEPRFGSQQDLNAHNVLFDGPRLTVIDWDAAGPQFPRFERAAYPVLWAQTSAGGYDLERTSAFCRGYRDAGGILHRDDTEAVWMWLRGVIHWAEENVRLAIQLGTHEQDRNASLLLEAVLRGPSTVTERQDVLRQCFRELSGRHVPGRSV